MVDKSSAPRGSALRPGLLQHSTSLSGRVQDATDRRVDVPSLPKRLLRHAMGRAVTSITCSMSWKECCVLLGGGGGLGLAGDGVAGAGACCAALSVSPNAASGEHNSTCNGVMCKSLSMGSSILSIFLTGRVIMKRTAGGDATAAQRDSKTYTTIVAMGAPSMKLHSKTVLSG
eukprot:CAMPEP_0194544214 /NCGR_PEP_ID=MMETSP0253-20130528/87176_1 /TAXON_ID=2966 /ORGANISM="Noctiluca scintillans" /LENGTH=172 /DNA_ID=CAMNT_0039391067 /DNA_START=147 /DNA_END=666 /DNA_ORIENTATION=-